MIHATAEKKGVPVDLLQLKYFIEVAECENVTIAANRLYISQSSLSRTIANLEKSIGVQLFTRTGNKISLNDAGKIFLETAYQACALINNGINLSRSMASGESLVSFSVPSSGLLSPFLEIYLAENPDVRATRCIQSHGQMIESLLKKEIDFALCYEPVTSELIAWEPFWAEEPYSAMVSTENPLSKQTSISLSQLVEERLIFGEYVYGSRLDTFFLNDAFFKATGRLPHILLNGGDIPLAVTLVERNLAVFIYPFTSSLNTAVFNPANQAQRHVILPIRDDFIQKELGIAQLKGRTLSKSAGKLLSAIKKHFVSRENERLAKSFTGELKTIQPG